MLKVFRAIPYHRRLAIARWPAPARCTGKQSKPDAAELILALNGSASPCAEVNAIASRHLAIIREKQAALRAM